MSSELPEKVANQIKSAGLPTSGECPFVPRLSTNRIGELVIEKRIVQKGPKKRKKGYVDTIGRTWVKDRAHAGIPDHWDVQIDGGEHYIRIDQHGNQLAP